MILVYITCKDRSEAAAISEHLLKKRLIACANMFPIESMYWWGGEINKEKEFVIIAKTLEKRFDQVREEIKGVHSYDIPCILGLEVDANEEFLKWVNGEMEG
jgi:periplasmic divalent cation tolerance protein